jgi:hypothetical protein
MKQLFLFSAVFSQLTVFTQVYNEYSTMPRTININIVQPMKPVKPVDYGALSSNLANDLNNISENRAAQKKAFDDMTSQAIRDVQNNKSLGYSSTLNGKLPQKLKRFEIESVKQKLYEKFKIYGVTNRCDFKASRRWHVGQRDLSSTRHQPADIF